MTAQIVSYTFDALPGGGSGRPADVESGPDINQLWYDPDDETSVGIRTERATLDAAGLLTRVQDIHARHPFTDPSTGEPYTDAALEQAVADWITAAGAGG